MTRVLVTGTAGFVGHRFVYQILNQTNWEIVAVDRLSSVLSRKRWGELNFATSPRIQLLKFDFGENILESNMDSIGNVDYIFHFGAETDVNKSIENPSSFIKSNIVGTFNFLEYARKQPALKYFVYISTNEVFGNSLLGEKFNEWHEYNCLNPYSATKAAAEDLTLAFSSTYQMPIMILHTMNLFGERQDPRKYIPQIVKSVLNNIELPIYTNELGEVGSRVYLDVDSFASAMFYLLEVSQIRPEVDNIDWGRDKFNIAGSDPINNLVLAKKVAEIIGKPLRHKLVDYYSSQPAHELHSALDCSRLLQTGWSPEILFDTQLENTVKWLVDNPGWLY